MSNYQAAPPAKSSSAGTVVVAPIDNDDDAFWNDAARQTAVAEKAFVNYSNSKKRPISPSSTDSAAYSLQTTECTEATDSFSSSARKPKLRVNRNYSLSTARCRFYFSLLFNGCSTNNLPPPFRNLRNLLLLVLKAPHIT